MGFGALLSISSVNNVIFYIAKKKKKNAIFFSAVQYIYVYYKIVLPIVVQNL